MYWLVYKYFLEKNMVFQSFSDFEGQLFGFLAKKFRQGCESCILRVQKNILGFSKIFLKREEVLANIVQRERNWQTSG